MNKKLLATLSFCFSTYTFAHSPSASIAGAIVNDWNQAGLGISDEPFDRASGQPFIGTPLNESRGSIFGSTIQEFDEQTYAMNIEAVHTARLAIEREREQLAREDWAEQKTRFYLYDLNISHEELLGIEKSTDKLRRINEEVVRLAESGPGLISTDEFTMRTAAALAEHRAEVLAIIGQQQFDRAAKFQEDYNKQVWEKFGVRLHFVGF